MNEIFARGMASVTRLTQAGRLSEATALIKSLLQRGDAGAGTGADVSDASPRRAAHTHELEATANALPSSRADEDVRKRSTAARRSKAQRHPELKPSEIRHTRDVGRGPTAAPGAFIAGSFANGAGQRGYKLYVPNTRSESAAPLIVMLHGCTQSPDDFAAGTRMNACAEEHGCFVVYPEQSSSANASRCWNWFNSADQQRDRGEPSIIADLTQELANTYPIDPRRIYVAGLSAGGAAAAVLGETYPDVYAAVGVHSGLACGAARDMPSAFMAMGGHGEVRNHEPSNTTIPVPTIVFHGDRDRTVHPRNGVDVIARANRNAQLQSLTENGTMNGRSFTRSVHRDKAGNAMTEEWVIHEAGHAWSGGCRSGSFADDKGPDASREMLRFFLLQSLPAK